ncbi:MAG: YraN family protein [Anaerolineales bacterium]|nr:YraN family protein [Anaerolineales bacterium]
MNKHRLGAWGEGVAAEYLREKGYEILSRNWRSPEGEIDLVALDGDTFVFVEVRTRSSDTFGTPEESLTQRKRHRLKLAGLAYLDAMQAYESMWRIDVVAIEVTSSGAVKRLDHYEDAIDGSVKT